MSDFKEIEKSNIFEQVGALNNLLSLPIERQRLEKMNLMYKQEKKLVYTLTDNIQAMNMPQVSGYISKVIKDMCDTSEDQTWIKELKAFGRQHGDIVRILCVENEGTREFIIVMADSSKDEVLDYNDYGFKMLAKYSEQLNDFMVLDNDTSEGITHMYSKVQIIYAR